MLPRSRNPLPLPKRKARQRKAVILASGPSLTQADIDYIRGKGLVIAVNDCHRLAPWADILYACDLKWWRYHRGCPEFSGQKWTQSDIAAREYGLRHIEGINAPGFSLRPGLIHYGANGGYQAINLALHFGAEQIILLGFDMQRSGDGKKHWFGEHPEPLNMHDGFDSWIAAFETTPASLLAAGVDVINCSRDTALTCFPRRALREVI